MITTTKKLSEAERVRKELQSIQDRDKDNKVRPEAVVEFARNKSTALHKKFEWRNDKAASEYRLWQARQIINVYVTVLPHPEASGPIRAWVSLASDRVLKGGGYRSIESVLTNDEKRAELLGQAIRDLKRLQQQYRLLSELDPVFRAINAVSRRAEAKKGKPKPK